MIVICNVSPEGSPSTGTNQYEVRINHKVITSFEHDRSYKGLSQCLREAADAVDRQEAVDMEGILQMVFPCEEGL